MSDKTGQWLVALSKTSSADLSEKSPSKFQRITQYISKDDPGTASTYISARDLISMTAAPDRSKAVFVSNLRSLKRRQILDLNEKFEKWRTS